MDCQNFAEYFIEAYLFGNYYFVNFRRSTNKYYIMNGFPNADDHDKSKFTEIFHLSPVYGPYILNLQGG